MSPFRRLVSCTILLLLSAWYGCGPGNPLNRQAVSGNVTFGGQPLDQGTVRFVPQDSSGVGGGTEVSRGAYRIPKAQGLPPGKYLVRLHSSVPAASPAGDEALPAAGAEGMERPGIERIARRYNAQSDIIVEVVADGENRFDFDVAAK